MSFSAKKQEYIEGLKSLFARNAILIILFNSANQYGNYMATGIIGKYALNNLSISAAIVGVCASLYSLGGLLFRAPSGKLVDRKDPKTILLIALIAKAFVFLSYIIIPKENAVMFGIVRFLHGVTWSFIGVCGPALLSLYVDRAAIGSAYALFLGIQQIVIASARSVSISIMDSHGAVIAYLACAAETLIPILLVSMMRPRRKIASPEQKTEMPAAEKETVPDEAQAAGKTGGFVCWRLVPLCLMSSLPMMTYAAESNFLPALCEYRGVEYLGVLAATTSISGVVSVIIGILCDVVNPYILCLFSLFANGAGMFLIGRAQTSAVMGLAFLLYFGFGKSFNAPFTVTGMKMITSSEVGSYSGTNLFIDDLFTLLAGSTAGIVANFYGLGTSFQVIGCLPLAGLLIMIFFKEKIFPRPMRDP